MPVSMHPQLSNAFHVPLTSLDPDPSFYTRSSQYGMFGGTNESEVNRLIMHTINKSLTANNGTSIGNLVLETSIQPPVMIEHVPAQGFSENCVNKKTFQNHMRWRESLRECMHMIEKDEIGRRSFYDVVMRVREDSFVLKTLLVHKWLYDKRLTSEKLVPMQFE